jgi:glycosyltransferase involved in cell wall biosynthesis
VTCRTTVGSPADDDVCMRIGMISTPFVPVPPRDYGGTELIVHELVEGLLQRGHDVVLFATGDSRSRGRLEALYPQGQWPPEPLAELNHVSWALRRVAEGGFDLVHAHSAPALAVARLTVDLPVVYTLHHAMDPALTDYYRYFPEITFVAISTDQARREPGARAAAVIHHGLDPSAYRWTTRPRDYVCFLGRFAPEKGVHIAIDAAGRVGVPILVAGETHPPGRLYYEREIVPRLGARHVTLLGPVGPTDKARLLRDARALLAPIDWEEPFGLVLIEAMLSGCPVVAFARGSVPELVETGVTGFVVRTVEEMARAIRPGGPVDRLDRRRIRELAALRFGRDRMVEEYEGVYHLVADRGARGRDHPSTAA